MKEFSCGDVIPGCDAQFRFPTEAEVLSAVAAHARRDHGFTEVTDAMVGQVRAAIRSAAPVR
jgi:predicted small metal-binding protein